MVSFGNATTRTAALLLLLTPSAGAFTPPKTSTSSNIAAGSSSSKSPPKAISIPVDESTTTSAAPWDRISKGQDTTTTTGGRDDWVLNLDYEAFAKDVTALGKELQKSSGPDDVEHLNKVRTQQKKIICAYLGTSTSTHIHVSSQLTHHCSY